MSFEEGTWNLSSPPSTLPHSISKQQPLIITGNVFIWMTAGIIEIEMNLDLKNKSKFFFIGLGFIFIFGCS